MFLVGKITWISIVFQCFPLSLEKQTAFLLQIWSLLVWKDDRKVVWALFHKFTKIRLLPWLKLISISAQSKTQCNFHYDGPFSVLSHHLSATCLQIRSSSALIAWSQPGATAAQITVALHASNVCLFHSYRCTGFRLAVPIFSHNNKNKCSLMLQGEKQPFPGGFKKGKNTWSLF